MDHIPLPYNCSFRPIQVPYLDSISDDPGPWCTYPQRHGWQVNYNRESTVLLRDGEKRPIGEVAAFIQAWLYFGFLREVLGSQIDFHRFVGRGASKKQRVSTEDLEFLLQSWTISFSRHGDPNIQQSLGKLYGFLIEHRTVSLRMCQLDVDLGKFSILLSIAVLSERFMAAVIDMHAHNNLETPVEQTWRMRSEGIMDLGQPVLSLMRDRRWCPYDLRRLDVDTKEISLLYYYSNMKAPRSSKDHSNCSEMQCLAMMTNLSTYKLSHRREGCHCPLLFADQSEVARILAKGSIPLIKITIDSGSKVGLLRALVAIFYVSRVTTQETRDP